MVSGQRPPSTELSLSKIPYSRKLLSEKTFTNFAVLWLAIRESFLRKIWERGVLWHSKSEQSVNIFHQFAKVFSLKSFPLYST